MDTRAEAAEVIKGQLLALEGFDEELVRGMDLVEIVPSVLEDGEMPEAVHIGRWSHPNVVATDRRLILANYTLTGLTKTKSLGYEDIHAIERGDESGDGENIDIVMTDGELIVIGFYKSPSTGAFIEHLTTKGDAARGDGKSDGRQWSGEWKTIRQRVGPVRCKKCGGEQLSTQPKGFDWGKAIVGGVLTLPVLGIGALFGFWGYGKTIVTCVGCGHAWYAGQR